MNSPPRLIERDDQFRSPPRLHRGLRRHNIFQANIARPAPLNMLSFNSELNIPPSVYNNDVFHRRFVEDLSYFPTAISVNVDSTISAYDFIVGEIQINPLSIPKDNILFRIQHSYFLLPISTLTNDLNDRKNIIYECHSKKEGAPYKKNVKFSKPYYLLRGTGNYPIDLEDLNVLLVNGERVYDIQKTSKHLTHTASYESILRDYTGTGLNGSLVDITSSDHCQVGSSRHVYRLVPIEFAVSGGGSSKSVDLTQILLTKPMINATRKLRSNINVSKFLKQQGTQGFKLTRLNRMQHANLDKLEPVVLKKVKNKGRKINGVLKQVYEVIDGRHRITTAIASGKTSIRAKIIS